ncbi:mandelate racemase/muconate lactonizing enzyme family protein [Lysinibacillus sp. LZ02]|uniref:mandelate racemase/muconate lactonizing enzyme family protein n=1 Tax=Lysinibacillus sp. LZ02 TaxID=3420668 RepID=UPI003D36A7B4
MNIKQLEIFAIDLPLIEPFIVSYDTYPSMPSIIVKLTTECGLVGWGEAVPDDHVTGETFEGTYAVLKHRLAPQLIGENPMNFERIHELMDSLVKNAPAAKAAIDIACFDVTGKKLGVPVYQLIGGRYHENFPITHVLSIGEPEKMAMQAAEKVAEGYRSFKMKVGRDVASDVARIKAVRERVGETIAIRVDVNQGWRNSGNTLQALAQLEEVGLDWLEQPVVADDIDAMVEIKSKTAVPVMIDEGICNFRDMREIIAKRAADKVNIKLMKCGGIYRANQLAAMAEMAGMECQIGSMLESSIGSSAGFHVAFSKKVMTSVELTGPLKFSKDIGNLRASYKIPFIELGTGVGLGVEIDESMLAELTQYSDVIR